LPLRGQIWARYVRLELNERHYFHLAQVEIFVETKYARVAEIGRALGFQLPILREPNSVYPEMYQIVSSKPASLRENLIGLKVNENGAFGNCVIQYANAIEIALSAGLEYIQLGLGGLARLDKSFIAGGITFLPADAPIPDFGCFLEGYFFHTPPSRVRTCESYHSIIKDVVKSLFPGVVSEPKSHDEFAIHIRSGDIFSSWVHADYVQPPLAFYILVIEKLLEEGMITKVKMVFEDRQNPVIDPLEKYLRDHNIPYSCQSGTVIADINALINARHMAYGVGTFGPAICHFSNTIENVFNFVPEGANSIGKIPNITRFYNVIDESNGYIKTGEWINNEKQRSMMIEYPIENLKLVSVDPES
jgi:hypothetical protein